MRKNDKIEIVVDDIGVNGEGIAHYDGYTIFVPYLIVGESAIVHILKVKDNIAWAKVEEIKISSNERIKPKCKYYQKCGGCVLEHVNSPYELKIKSEKIINAFKKNAGYEIKDILVVDSDKLYGYRNKSAFPIREINREKAVCMFRGSSHTPIQIDRCELAEENINIIINIFNEFLNENDISCYDEQTNTGLVKFLVIRVIDNIPLVTIVINGKDLPYKKNLCELLSKQFKIFGLNLNINTINNNVILTDKLIHVYGEKELKGEDFDIKYPVSSLSFLQINNFIKNQIYKKVLDNIISNDIVVDAYSGAGLLSAMMAKKAQKVYGIEIIKDATKNADMLAKSNNILNLTNINGDCAIELPKLIKTVTNGKIKVVLDPPRKGCDKKVIDAIILSKVQEIIYISCNPATLARDAKILFDAGYKLYEITGFNMFPQTEHVETLAIFKKG